MKMKPSEFMPVMVAGRLVDGDCIARANKFSDKTERIWRLLTVAVCFV